MEPRDRILSAAIRVYAQHGFRGATTRRIADEAGVNEITLFRHFGSKAALIEEAIRLSAGGETLLPPLPAHPVDPERELSEWCAGHLEHLRRSRSLIRKTMGELEERPDAAPCVSEGAYYAAHQLRDYVRGLDAAGLVTWGKESGSDGEVDPYAAGAMLMGALFADAMGRDMMPDMYPQPAERAAAMYARVFLRAIGVRGGVAAERAGLDGAKDGVTAEATPDGGSPRRTRRSDTHSHTNQGRS